MIAETTISPATVREALRIAGVSARVKDGQLLVTPAGRLSPELREAIVTHRDSLIARITRSPSGILEERLERGACLLEQCEQKGRTDTPEYKQHLALFDRLLRAYEAACQAEGRVG